ncbi:transcription termination factor Rho [Tessaracoccus sp. ZS01]|uniref:transcription termination factor Rho n=1 Tax=Tessaracoccus sp. ZS01 TaxID=1906324 RepID=UPI00096C8608|nr:transcription termination factor Rho [Tessaracoccus sp. ZS01]MCG6566309.1 transcription termination factor Rho [Tessaracoccus sp. ZS01]OMG58782.1 transcription termination factor Rho [Tessaracoccus sp. ZS01]
MSESADLSSMKLVDLKQVATGLGIKGISAMRKADLVSAIQNQGGGRPARQRSAERPAQAELLTAAQPKNGSSAPEQPRDGESSRDQQPREQRDQQPREQRQQRDQQPQRDQQSRGDQQRGDQQQGDGTRTRRRRGRDRERQPNPETIEVVGELLEAAMGGAQPAAGGQQQPQQQQREQQPAQSRSVNVEPASYDDDQGGSRRGRRRRSRDRDRNQRRPTRGGQGMDRMDAEVTVTDDDELANISGIVDINDNYAFVRTTGYLPGPADAYLSMATVRRYGLRRGDVISGAVRVAREGERKDKFQPLVRIDSVNGDDPEKAKGRPEFQKLTPLYPQERLRLETVQNNLTGRIIDMVSPIGKGQRGLIVSPPKAGKTMIMQSIANAIAANNPEVHLMVVLVDERPEEVTDFQRTVSGEVIASTFDRPAEDHTMISELAIERAKRLVELGHDVVVLLDGITRLGRAYNLAAPASGRILSGGVDSAALYPPKKFFGAARNIENGGSLTILATALIETGSKMDEVIFEEFKGTGNMELRLRRELADKRIFPAIDVDASGTRREDLLLNRDELQIIWKLRRALSGLDNQAALETLKSRMTKTASNHDFLLSVLKTTPAQDG